MPRHSPWSGPVAKGTLTPVGSPKGKRYAYSSPVSTDSRSVTASTGVAGPRDGCHRESARRRARLLGEHGCDHLRSDHVIGLAVDVVQVDAVALLVPHDADEFPATTWAQGPFCGGVPCAAPLPPNAALASGGGGLSLERRELRYAGVWRRPESLDLCLVHRHRSPECLKDNWTRREETATPLSVGNFRPHHTPTSHRELQPREMGGTSAWLGRRSDSDTRVMLRSGSKVPSGSTLCGQSAQEGGPQELEREADRLLPTGRCPHRHPVRGAGHFSS